MTEWITSDRRMELRREADRRWQAEYASMDVDIRTMLNLLDALDAAEKQMGQWMETAEKLSKDVPVKVHPRLQRLFAEPSVLDKSAQQDQSRKSLQQYLLCIVEALDGEPVMPSAALALAKRALREAGIPIALPEPKSLAGLSLGMVGDIIEEKFRGY